MIRPSRVAVLAIALSAAAIHAQTPATQMSAPQATFRGGTDLVQVDVSVLDSKRHPVRALTAADFTIFEDGEPREIQAFSEVNLPDRIQARDASWTREVPTDVATNQVAKEEGRLVIILLDRTIPVGEPTITARRVAAAAINQLGPSDLAAVVSTSNGAVQNLTSDHSRLLRAISESDLSTDISDEAKEIEASVFQLTGRTWSTLNDPRCQCGLCVLETITRVADALQNTQGRRKVMLFIGSDLLLQSAGSSRDLSSDVGCGNRLRDGRDVMFTAVDRANLTIHSLDPSGLANISPTTRASSTLRLGSGPSPVVANATSEFFQRQGNLRVLPDRTGGRAIMNTNGPDLLVPQIFHESDSYYLIGFRPAEPGANGKFHRITVKTNRRGLDVRARSGYTAATVAEVATAARPGATLAAPVREALTGLLPAGATSADLNAATFALPGTQKGAVVLTVGVGAFASERSSNGPLEIVATAFDTGGRPKGMSRQTLELSWPAAAGGAEHRFDALSRIDLPPGEYEVRVAVESSTRTASVFSDITVPAYASAPLTISNIVINATAGTLTAPKDFLSSVLPIIPTGRREFARSDRLTAFFRIYQGIGRQDAVAPVQLRSSIIDAHGTTVASENSAIGVDQFATGRTADHYLTVPLATLAPGEYLLQIETTMGSRVAGRAIRFSVKS